MPSASSATFTWEDMTNYVGQRENFLDNCGPQNEAQNETHSAKVFKMFFDEELVELIVHETNIYAAQKIQARICGNKMPTRCNRGCICCI